MAIVDQYQGCAFDHALVAGGGSEGIIIDAMSGRRIATIPESGPAVPCR